MQKLESHSSCLMNEDKRSVYTAVTTHMVLLKVKDGPSYHMHGARSQRSGWGSSPKPLHAK